MALPMFSVDTKEEGESLLTLVCFRAYDGRLILRGFKQELSDMDRTGKFLRDMHALQRGDEPDRLNKMRRLLAEYRGEEFFG